MNFIQTVLGTTLLALLLGLQPGCGGADEPPAKPAGQARVPAPAETAALTFLLVPAQPQDPTARATSEALRSALVGAGYRIVVDRSAPHDVAIVAHVTAAAEQSMFTVQVNGKTDTKERVHLAASVTSRGQVVDELTADFVSKNSQVAPDDVLPVANALATSQKVSQFAKQLHEEADAREHAKQEKDDLARQHADQETKKKQRIEEESDWNRARVTGCRLPTSLTGCDAVRTYLAKYPGGAHAEEAQTAISASEPAMEKLQKDENTWKTAGVDSCRIDRTRDACTGVELYITKFPAGIHLDEAQSLLRGRQ